MNKIKEFRKEKGLSQQALASLINTSQANISAWELEKWEPSQNELKKLSKVFEVSVDDLIDNTVRSKVNNQTFCNNLRELRGELSQERYAKIFGLTQRTYSNYETGIREPDIETLIKIANYHNISVDYLIGHDNAIMKRPYSEIAENFIKEFQELFSEERFIKIARTYKKLDDKQRDAFLLAILMYAGGTGIKMA